MCRWRTRHQVWTIVGLVLYPARHHSTLAHWATRGPWFRRPAPQGEAVSRIQPDASVEVGGGQPLYKGGPGGCRTLLMGFLMPPALRPAGGGQFAGLLCHYFAAVAVNHLRHRGCFVFGVGDALACFGVVCFQVNIRAPACSTCSLVMSARLSPGDATTVRNVNVLLSILL